MGNTANIPTLRFPEFSELWCKKSFGELYTFITTNSFSRDMLNYDGGSVKNIHYGDIHTKFNLLFNIEKEFVPFINSDINISGISEENYVQEGDLILADASENYNDIGKSIEVLNLNNKKVLSGLHTILARRKTDELAIGFAAFLMKTYNVRLEIMRIAQGTKVLGLSSRRLAEIPLWIPKPEEQTKIANFLTAIDKRINLLTNQKEHLELYKKGLMHKIFSQELRFKDENGEEFPEWEDLSIGNLCQVKGGFAFKSQEFKKEGVPIIRISNISNKNNFIESDNMVFSNKRLNDKNYIIQKGDLLIAMSGATTGKASIYNHDKPAYLNQRVGIFKSKNKKLFYPFLVQYIFSEIFRKNLSTLLVAGAQPNVSSFDIESLPFPFPSENEQKRIGLLLSRIDLQIENVTSQIDNTNQIKRGLLIKMFV